MISVSHPVFRACALGAAFAAPNSFARAQAPVHLESRIGWSHSSVSNAALDARLRGAAVQYRSYAPVPRIAFFDIAYPKDSAEATTTRDRKSTRLNSSHSQISYAVFCLKKKKQQTTSS